MKQKSFDFEIKELIGKGSFGEVYLALKKGTNQKYAIKKINKQKIQSANKINSMMTEITVLSMLNHPNIVKFFSWSESQNNYYLATEYVNGGDLAMCLKKYKEKYNTPFPENIVKYLMKQILDALNYMHKNKIVHRDLKLDNIMVNFDNPKDKDNLNMLKAKVKIIDFGVSRHLNKNDLLKSAVGTLINMDPVIVENYRNKVLNRKKEPIKGYDEKCDIWSVGTVCYELIIGNKIFDSKTLDDLWDKINEGRYILPKTLSQESISFLNAMLQFEASERSSAEDLLNHEFLKNDAKDFHYMKMEFAPKNSKKEMKKSIWDVFKDEDKFSKIGQNNKYQNNNNQYQNNNNQYQNNNNQYQNNNNQNPNYNNQHPNYNQYQNNNQYQNFNDDKNINNINLNLNKEGSDNLGRRKSTNAIYWKEIEKWKQFYGFNGTSFYGQSMGVSQMNQNQNQQNNVNLNKVNTFPYKNNYMKEFN